MGLECGRAVAHVSMSPVVEPREKFDVPHGSLFGIGDHLFFDGSVAEVGVEEIQAITVWREGGNVHVGTIEGRAEKSILFSKPLGAVTLPSGEGLVETIIQTILPNGVSGSEVGMLAALFVVLDRYSEGCKVALGGRRKAKVVRAPVDELDRLVGVVAANHTLVLGKPSVFDKPKHIGAGLANPPSAGVVGVGLAANAASGASGTVWVGQRRLGEGRGE